MASWQGRKVEDTITRKTQLAPGRDTALVQALPSPLSPPPFNFLSHFLIRLFCLEFISNSQSKRKWGISPTPPYFFPFGPRINGKEGIGPLCFFFFCSHMSDKTNHKEASWCFWTSVLSKTPDTGSNIMDSQGSKRVDHQTTQSRVLIRGTNEMK